MNLLLDSIYWSSTPLQVAGLPLGRNEVAIKLRDGSLFLHSPPKISESHLRELAALGPVRWILLPSRVHTLFYEDYFGAFPAATFIGVKSVLAEFKRQPDRFVSIEDLPQELKAELDFEFVAGMPKVDEVVAFHRRTGSLLVTDLVFNLPPPTSLMSRLMLNAAGMGGGVKASRLFRFLISDRQAFAHSLRRILQFPLQRILVSHGLCIEQDAKAILASAFKKEMRSF